MNVHERTINSRHRLRAANGKHETLEVAEPLSWWDRLSPESLMVAAKEVKGFVVPHWAAGVLLASILAVLAFMYNQIAGQRDLLIRLETRLEERDKHELEYRSEFKTKLNVQQLQIDQSLKEMAVVKAVLSPDQVRIIERNTRKAEQ